MIVCVQRQLDVHGRQQSKDVCLQENDHELEEGLRSLAAPIRDRNGRVVAAVNISTQSSRYTAAAIRADMLPALLETAEAIGLDLARITR